MTSTHKFLDYVSAERDSDSATRARFQKMFGDIVDEDGRPRSNASRSKQRRPEPTDESSPEFQALGEAVADEVERLIGIRHD